MKNLNLKAHAALASVIAQRGETQTLEQSPRTSGGATTKPEAPQSDPLSAAEKASLKRLESVIEHGIKVFVQVGNALTAIRDERLYRESHPTFETYCRERWGFSKTHANRLIQSAGVAKNLAPIGVIPQSESQVRALSGLAPADQVRVFKNALKAAEGKTTAVTAKAISDAAQKLGLRTAAPVASTQSAGNVSGGRGGTAKTDDKLVNRDQVIESITAWAEENWERVSILSVADFISEVTKVVKKV